MKILPTQKKDSGETTSHKLWAQHQNFFFILPFWAKPLEARGEAASYIYNNKNKNIFGSWKENEVAGFVIFSQWLFSYF